MHRFTLGAAASLALATLMTAPALADELLRLTWNAPAGCPLVESVQRAALRGSYTTNVVEVLEADARVEPLPVTEAQRWTVTLRTRRGNVRGERTLQANTCEGVADATAVVLALALTSSGAAPGAEEPTTQPSSHEHAAPATPLVAAVIHVPVTSDTVTSEPREPARRRGLAQPHGVALGLSVAGDASSLPLSTVGGSLTLAWTDGRARLELDARRWAPRTRMLDELGAGARFSMSSFGARGCWALLRNDRSRFDVAPCVGADVHFVSAPGRGVDPNYDARGRWVAAAAGGLARFSLASWLLLRARVEASLPLARPTFVVEGGGPLHQPTPIGTAGSFGVELLFL